MDDLKNLLHENRRFSPNPQFVSRAKLNRCEEYDKEYLRSIENPSAYWLEKASELSWIKTPKEGCHYVWDSKALNIQHSYFKDGTLNVCYNCLDRHVAANGTKKAIIWQGEEDAKCRFLTYQELLTQVCRLSNALKEMGVKKGDRVCLYLSLVPELAIAMLACARVGAIHTVVFGGFSAHSLAGRINDCSCRYVITSYQAARAGKVLPFKTIVDTALATSPTVEKVLVLAGATAGCAMQQGRDFDYHTLVDRQSNECEIVEMGAEDPLFILYTSGSTGQPKGVVHTQGGYLLYVSMTHRYVFDLQQDDVYWCTADLGWVTGHSYVLYGPLANGTTTLLFEGVPTYPDAGRFWQIVEKYKVSIFYTAPTAIRTLMAQGALYPKKYDLSSLRLLGTVGEPINPDAWVWYHTYIGNGKCPIVDTWWQTETGGIMISPRPGIDALKPGSAMRPFFGVTAKVVDKEGKECAINHGGLLVITSPWPGMMRTTWGDHERFVKTYFQDVPNVYFSGDGARRDEDSDFWLLGRMDDVVNVSGHRIGTAEVESAFVSHPSVAEAAVVPIEHKVKGQALYAFISLNHGVMGSKELKEELKTHIRKEIGAIAIPDTIQFAPLLPKTRSGKIMRRILRKIASGDTEDLGDISTLADPSVIPQLL